MVSIGVGTRLTDAIGTCVYNAVAGIIQTLYLKEPPRASRRVKSVSQSSIADGFFAETHGCLGRIECKRGRCSGGHAEISTESMVPNFTSRYLLGNS